MSRPRGPVRLVPAVEVYESMRVPLRSTASKACLHRPKYAFEKLSHVRSLASSPPDRQPPFPFLAPVANPATHTVSPLSLAPGAGPRPTSPTHSLTSGRTGRPCISIPWLADSNSWLIPRRTSCYRGVPTPNTIVRPGLWISVPVDPSTL